MIPGCLKNLYRLFVRPPRALQRTSDHKKVEGNAASNIRRDAFVGTAYCLRRTELNYCQAGQPLPGKRCPPSDPLHFSIGRFLRKSRDTNRITITELASMSG